MRCFEQVSTDLETRAGLEIDHRIRPLLGIPMLWRSRIESFDPPHSFVDVQVRGPYRLWHHTHSFEPDGDGTLMRDRVRYALPFGSLGEAAHALLVRRDLDRIFAVRHAVVRARLG